MPRPEPIPNGPRGTVNYTSGGIAGPAGLITSTSYSMCMWTRFLSAPGDWALAINTNGSTYVGIGLDFGQLVGVYATTSAVAGLFTFVVGTWYFVAVVANGTTITGYSMPKGGALTTASQAGVVGNAADVMRISNDGAFNSGFAGNVIAYVKAWGFPMTRQEILDESVQGAPVCGRQLKMDLRMRNKSSASADDALQSAKWGISTGTLSNSTQGPPVPEFAAPMPDDEDASAAAAAAPSLFFFPDAPVLARPSPIQVVSALGPLPIPNPTPTPLDFFELNRRLQPSIVDVFPGPISPPVVATILQPLVSPDASARPQTVAPSLSPIAPVPERTSPLVATMVEPPRPPTPVASVGSSQAIQEQKIPLGRIGEEPPPRPGPTPSPTFALGPAPERTSPLVAAMNEPPRPGAPTPPTGSTAAIQEQTLPLGRVEPEPPGRPAPTAPAAFSLGPQPERTSPLVVPVFPGPPPSAPAPGFVPSLAPRPEHTIALDSRVMPPEAPRSPASPGSIATAPGVPEQPVALAAHQQQPEPPRSSVAPASTATSPEAPERTAIAPLLSAPDHFDRATPPDARSSIGPAPERKIVLMLAGIDPQPPRPAPTPLSPSSVGPSPLPNTVPTMVYTAPEQLPRSAPSPLTFTVVAPRPIPNPPLSTTAIDPPRPGLPTPPPPMALGPSPLPNPIPTPSWSADPPTSRPSLTSAGTSPIPFVPPASFVGAYVPPTSFARELRQASTDALPPLLTPVLPAAIAAQLPRALEQRSSTASIGAPERTLPILPAIFAAPTPSLRMLDVQAPAIRPPFLTTLPAWIERAAASGVRAESITWSPVPIAPPAPPPLFGATWFEAPRGRQRDDLWWLSPIFFDGAPPPIIVTNNPATVGLTSSPLATVALTQARLAAVKLTESTLATVALSHSTLAGTGS